MSVEDEDLVDSDAPRAFGSCADCGDLRWCCRASRERAERDGAAIAFGLMGMAAAIREMEWADCEAGPP